MSYSALAGKISNSIISNMYRHKGIVNGNGERVYKKNGCILGCGIVLVLIFIPCIFCNNYFIDELIFKGSIEENMRTTYTILGYAIELFMTMLGCYLIILYKKFRFILSNERVVCYGILSKKSIEFFDLEKIIYSNARGLIFTNYERKIKFGIYTNGLIEVLAFIEDNIPKYKYEDSIEKARRMLRNNRIEQDL